jgi:glycosyltransferase involved in cell wall biosynthesis
VLQYFAAGIPAVGSPVGITRELIGNQRGVLADSEAEWHSALASLIEDPLQRAEMGAAGREFVERHYSFQHWAPELASILKSVAD